MGNDDFKKCTVHCVCFSGFSKFNFWISTRYTGANGLRYIFNTKLRWYWTLN